MRSFIAAVVLAVVVAGLLVNPTVAADGDELVPGKLILIKPAPRDFVKFISKPPPNSTFDLPDPGNEPTVGGADVEVFDTQFSGGYYTQALAAPMWEGLGDPPGAKGWKYTNTSAFCRKAFVRPKLLLVLCRRTGTTLTTPFNGDVGVILSISGGAKRYCAEFGGVDWRNALDKVKRFDAAAPSACPMPITSTTSTVETTTTSETTTSTSTTTTASGTVTTTSTSLPCGTFLLKWGTPGLGGGDGQFYYPWGVAANGSVYVADIVNKRMQKFDSSGAFLLKWGTGGSGDGQFNFPGGVAVDASGNVYVTDIDNERVQKFDSNGVFLLKWGSAGSGDGEFLDPSGVAVDAAGNVYVADRFNSRVQKFDSSGNFLLKWGSAGSGDGQFLYAEDVAVDATGNVYVADSNVADSNPTNSRIQKFDSNGTFLLKWGTLGATDGQFDLPTGVAVDADGDVYVVDHNNARVQKFDASGNFLSKWGTAGGGDGQFISPLRVAVHDGSVYVSDYGNNRIQMFACQ